MPRETPSGADDVTFPDDSVESSPRVQCSADVVVAYIVNDNHPLDQPDEWGDLATFREATSLRPAPSVGLPTILSPYSEVTW